MRALLAAASAMAMLSGILLMVAGARRTPEQPPRPRRSWRPRLAGEHSRIGALAAVGLVAGLLVFAVSGWFLAVLAGPLATIGIPYLLRPPKRTSIDRLDAMAEWTRSLAGVLTVGMGLEQALIATQRSTPGGLAPDVDRLVARLRARWTTEAALRSFADDLDDATGDLIAAALILGSRRRGSGLSTVLAGLSESVAAEVRVRRQIEADRAKPRSTARRITLITLGVLGALFLLNPTYVAPYGTPVGQLTLGLLLAAYAGALLWLRRAAEDRPMPRILGAQVSREVQR